MTDEEYRRNKEIERKEQINEFLSYFGIASILAGGACIMGLIFGGIDTLQAAFRAFMFVYFGAFALYIGNKIHVLAALIFIVLVWLMCGYAF